MTPGDEPLSETERALLEQFLEKVGVRPVPLIRHGGTGRILNPSEEGRERKGYAPPYPEVPRA